MNMKKALAAGVAATLAVTSLSAIVSADDSLISTIINTSATDNTKTFDMTKTIGTYKLSGNINLSTYGNGLNLGSNFYLTDEQWQNGWRLVGAQVPEGLEDAQEALAAAQAELAEVKAQFVTPAQTALDEAAAELADTEYVDENNESLTATTYADLLTQINTAITKAARVVTKTKNAYDTAIADYATALSGGDQTTIDNAETAMNEALTAYQNALTAQATVDAQAEDVATDLEAELDALADAEAELAEYEAKVEAAQAAVTAILANFGNNITNWQGPSTGSVTQYADYLEVSVPRSIVKKLDNASKLKLYFAVEGVFGTRTAGRSTVNYELVPYQTTDTAFIYRFYVYGDVAPTGGFQPNKYLEITNLKLITDGSVEIADNSAFRTSGKRIITQGLTEAEYNAVGKDNPTASELTLLTDLGLDNSKGFTENGTVSITHHFDNSEDAVKALAAGTKVTAAVANDQNIFDQLELLISDLSGVKYTLVDGSKATGATYAFLPMTVAADADVIGRNQVALLSSTDAYRSGTVIGANADRTLTFTTDYASGRGQTYNADYRGTIPNFFGGLASQVADFFNKYYQGSITFKLVPGSSNSTASSWINGGVPSTEVGIKTLLSSMSQNNIALFVNYGSTTGSLQAVTQIDTSKGEITFDISDILDALDGRTIGTIQDLYYGLNKGTDTYGNTGVKGFWINEVKLERKDADVAAETEDATDEVENDAADVADDVEDEVPEVIEADDEDTDDTDADDEDIAADDEDVAADDEDDYTEDEDDFADDEADTADDVDEPADVDDDVADDITADDADDTYVEPADDETATIDDTVAPAADDVAGENVTPTITPAVEADENPGTGVALAVVPAALAAAAIVISKKRK